MARWNEITSGRRAKSFFFLLFAFFPDPDKKIDSLLETVCAVNQKEMCTDRPPPELACTNNCILVEMLAHMLVWIIKGPVISGEGLAFPVDDQHLR